MSAEMSEEHKAEITARIKAKLERDMQTPEWQERMRESRRDMRSGNWIDARLTVPSRWAVLPWSVRRVMTVFLIGPRRYFGLIRYLRSQDARSGQPE